MHNTYAQNLCNPRLATGADAAELVRLRGIMPAALDGAAPAPGPWQEHAAATLRDRPGSTRMAAAVVDRPGGGGLAACAVGTVDRRPAGPHNPTGETGYVFNVATDPEHRRRGYARACLTTLLDWFDARGVTVVDLRASGAGQELYAQLGFRPAAMPGMRRRSPAAG